MISGKIVSEGYSWELGKGTHAEENVLNKLSNLPNNLSNSTIYCSMAPCTSRSSGKETCLDRLIRYKIKRVVYATLAPDEKKLEESSYDIQLIQLKDLELEARKANLHLSWNN